MNGCDSHLWQNKLFFLFSVCTLAVNIEPNVTSTACEDPRSANNLYELCCLHHLLTDLTILAAKIFDFDSDKMTQIWYQSSKQGWVSSGNMGGRTGQPLLKSFSITEEREAIVL